MDKQRQLNQRWVFLGIVGLGLGLSGCAVKSASQPALKSVVVTPESVIMHSLDGKELGMKFIGVKQRTPLSLGEHRAVLQYADLFELDGDDHETVKSALVAVTFTATQEGTYAVSHKPVKGLAESRTFSKQPEFELRYTGSMDSDNTMLIPLDVVGIKQKTLLSTHFDDPKNTTLKKSLEESSLPTLKNIKNLYQKLSPEDQKNFVNWLGY